MNFQICELIREDSEVIQIGKCGYNPQKGNEETAAKARELGADARAYVCDITQRDKVQHTANQVRADLGDVDILVNNAGIMTTKYLMDLTEAEIEKTFEVNIIAHFRVSR